MKWALGSFLVLQRFGRELEALLRSIAELKTNGILFVIPFYALVTCPWIGTLFTILHL